MTRTAVPDLSVVDYYRLPVVRARIAEYCGGTPPTCVFFAAMTPGAERLPTWERAPRVPPVALDALFAAGCDISRSQWDVEHLLVHLDLDYQNTDRPDAPYVHPADVFYKLEPVYSATMATLHRYGLPLMPVMTGRGYHFTGRVPLSDPVIEALAALVPGPPTWFRTVGARSPAWMRPERLSAVQAQAYIGWGMVAEFLAHEIVRRAAGQAVIPVVLNGTVVGSGLGGREAVSIDLSHAGDPLDVRHMRAAFSTYQVHRMRGDVVGVRVAHDVPPLVAIPRAGEALFDLLGELRTTRGAARLAADRPAVLPNVADGVGRARGAYSASRLGAFHRAFYADTPEAPERWPETYDRLELGRLWPCVASPLAAPNDRLLQPAVIQHVTRALLAEGWKPRDIAGLVHARYARDFEWGGHWDLVDPATRAEFDVRVFCGLVADGLDEAVDFNCRSAQEKGLCPGVECHHDLREDRARLAARRLLPP